MYGCSWHCIWASPFRATAESSSSVSGHHHTGVPTPQDTMAQVRKRKHLAAHKSFAGLRVHDHSPGMVSLTSTT